MHVCVDLIARGGVEGAAVLLEQLIEVHLDDNALTTTPKARFTMG